jgi:hypothetical protein
MSFQPINDDHAIQSATVAIGLARPLSWTTIETIIKSPLDWRRDLPAIEFPQLADIQINPQTGSPIGRMTRGVEFSHKRPDGSASWLLSVIGTEIKTITTIYTRWKPTWEKAGDILIGVAEQLALAEKDNGNSISGVSLLVTDVFLTEDQNPDYSELFARTDDIPAAVFRRGKIWHAHSGWFDQRSSGSILNHLNIEAKTGADEMSPIGAPEDRLRVVVQHNQIYRPQTPIAFKPPVDALIDALSTEVPLMHDKNKSLVASLLTETMQNRIKIKD